MSVLLGLLSGVSVRAWLVAGAVAVGLLAGAYALHAAYEQGYAAREAKEQAIIEEKTNAANRADDDARRCAADRDCRMRPDAFLRR